MEEHRHNHYVPQWYQRRFIPSACKQKKLHYLDLDAGYFVDPAGVCRARRPLRTQGTPSCFAVTDLYTTQFGATISVDIEKHFFGEVDDAGKRAVDYFANFAHPSVDGDALRALLRFMSTQRLRTPRGLAWLQHRTTARTKHELLQWLQQLENLYGAIWCESIWQIADASASETKFIISDNPVTFYNRDCPPNSFWTRRVGDPELPWHGTHTIVPLSLDKVLLITNLSWIRNPYQRAKAARPNPELFRDAIFNFTHIQTHRLLTEDEVRRLNYIVKKRASRYIAAGSEEWLFPEQHVHCHWREFGDDMLLMPDPRSVQFTGTMMARHNDGSTSAWDEYGLRPWQSGFGDKNRFSEEWRMFYRFRGEFARRHGPYRRGRAFHVPSLDPERDSVEVHASNLRYETEWESLR